MINKRKSFSMSGFIGRSKSMLKSKPTHGHAPNKEGIVRPVDELIDRNQQIKHIIKSLIGYYNAQRTLHHEAAKQLDTMQKTIQVPFHEGHQFLGSGGWQEALYKLRDSTATQARTHQMLADALEKSTISELEGLRAEIKKHISDIIEDAQKAADRVEHERKSSVALLSELDDGIKIFEGGRREMGAARDPALIQKRVERQLRVQVDSENNLQSSLIRFQQMQPTVEASIFDRIKSIVTKLDEISTAALKDISEHNSASAQAVIAVPSDAEWDYHLQSHSLISPDTPLRDPNHIVYPYQNHSSTAPIKEGWLERRVGRIGGLVKSNGANGGTKNGWREGWFVLTPSGYLHERAPNDGVFLSNDTDNKETKGLSLFLPECALGAPSKPKTRAHKFVITGPKALRSITEAGSGGIEERMRGIKEKSREKTKGKGKEWIFRTRTAEDLKSWWDAIDLMAGITEHDPNALAAGGIGYVAGSELTGTTTEASKDPIQNAVMNAGYASPEPASAPSAASDGASTLSPDARTPSYRQKRESQLSQSDPIAQAVANIGYAPETEHTGDEEAAAAQPVAAERPPIPTRPSELVPSPEVSDEEDDDYESESGSSVEEEPIASTSHPTEPTADTKVATTHSTEASAVGQEALPAYTGDGTSAAEQEAEGGDAKKKGMFSKLFG